MKKCEELLNITENDQIANYRRELENGRTSKTCSSMWTAARLGEVQAGGKEMAATDRTIM